MTCVTAMVPFHKHTRIISTHNFSLSRVPHLRNPAWVSDSRVGPGNDLPWMMLSALNAYHLRSFIGM